MEHEDKSPAHLTTPEMVGESAGDGRTRVVSAAAGAGGRTDAPSSSVVPRSERAESSEAAASTGSAGGGNRKRAAKGPGTHPNNVRRLRIERMMSKAELARRANVSVLTIDRVEKGFGCRMDTKRKILEALGLSLTDRIRVFGDDE